jgi:hypothetical protein
MGILFKADNKLSENGMDDTKSEPARISPGEARPTTIAYHFQRIDDVVPNTAAPSVPYSVFIFGVYVPDISQFHSSRKVLQPQLFEGQSLSLFSFLSLADCSSFWPYLAGDCHFSAFTFVYCPNPISLRSASM